MDSVRSVLPHVLAKRGLKTQAEAAFVVYRATAWIAEVLPTLASAISVSRLKDGTLTIRCEHSIALQECQGLASRLREHLKRECPDQTIGDIRVIRA